MNEESEMSGQNDTRTSTPERRILGELGNNPDSPTANLRLLTTLASMQMKTDTKSPCPGCSSSTLVAPVQSTQESSNKLLPRKEKSLSLLCNKFLNLYPLDIQDNEPREISLNATAEDLGTEKRRIYDIINVLESLEMASKAGKNQYLWHGHSRLPLTLAKLKMIAIELGLEKQIHEIQNVNRAYVEDHCQMCSKISASLMVPQSPVVNYKFPDNSTKDDKSLGVMCKKFVMLFLVSKKNGVINLDIAAKVLINEHDDSTDSKNSAAQSRFKTKVRRLYDIANVLSAIGLIEKVDIYNCVIRKPIFRYTGPSVNCLNLDMETPTIENNGQSLVGMATPNKKASDTFRFRALNRISKLYSSTPLGNKREARKRKLFDSNNTKFERTQSSPCLNSPKCRSVDRMEPILQAVNMELKRIKCSENKPKVCTKLFPRHNSDSCISPLQIDISSSSTETSDVASNSTDHSYSSTNLSMTPPIVSKENLVNNTSNTVTPVRTLRINVPVELKIAPITLQPSTTPKFVKLTNFDMRKLVPISKEDIKLKLPPGVQTPSTSKPNVAIFTQIPTKKISAGDIFKAIKVGNTFQLIPIKKKNDVIQKQNQQ
ncbi:transcription factor E2F8-like [Phymastichus coffea]|uniref:transcription factor E2F8-like n=1 Tax=Phymastichus coffea TaxID=108790 RepID=UPI00273AE490|nr:transcription factor E2F8-like [Phymastichus coffea]